MNLADYAIRQRVISWLFVVLLLCGGALSFLELGQLEFPEFTIKQAMVITAYPGASPEQVEEEVTLPLEDAIQQMTYGIDHIESISSAGLSQIMVEMVDRYDKHDLPQVWDELRRKISDAQGTLPPGVAASQVIDDYSDVFGILLNITGPDYSYRELEDFADLLRRELVLVPGVRKVSLAGTRSEQVVVEMAQARLNALGISPEWVFGLMQNQNLVSNAGAVFTQGQALRIHPTGEFASVAELEQMIISPPGSAQVVRLGDIARVYRSFAERPGTIYHSDGDPAISLGISFSGGVNVVAVGQAIEARLAELTAQQPLGMQLTTVYNQPQVVEAATADFLVNLIEAVVIVILVLLVAMGRRSGLLMGAVLLLTILGTFIIMQLMAIELQKISLGALIIALGMLVDNAIVITEGMLVGLQRGQTRLAAARQVVAQNQWPLLGATLIAVIAFAPIGLSEDASGEFAGSLFWVLLISLLLSWLTAITLTPFFCHLLFKELPPEAADADVDPYRGALFVIYRGALDWVLRHRLLTLGITALTLALTLVGFTQVKNQFFPASNTPIFFVDTWLPEGADIRATEAEMARLERAVAALPGVSQVTAVAGRGAQRFVLPYAPEKRYSSYSQLLVRAENLEAIDALLDPLERTLNEEFGNLEYRIKRMQNGPAPAAEIEARFYGEDPDVLRRLAAEAEAVFRAEPGATSVRHSWRNRVLVLRPELEEAAARRSGISKQALDNSLLINFSGKSVGLYREGSQLLPIVMRAPDAERLSVDSLDQMLVWSEEYNTFVPIHQVVSGFGQIWEDPLILRRDRKRVLAVYAEPRLQSGETTDTVLRRVKDRVEAIPLPPGYQLEWGGNYEMAGDAQAAVFGSLPLGYLAMFLITIVLFNSVRQPLAIWATVPLAPIGVVAGLLLLDTPFSFMGLLGLLSLSGMLIKNGIVLVEAIKLEEEAGQPLERAIVHAAVSRVRPVCMAALTTMLGMLPLIGDAFFSSLAVTVIFGLGFATLLTLLVLPVVYSLLYRVSFAGVPVAEAIA